MKGDENMKTYRVYVHYDGCFVYDIPAADDCTAEDIAMERFADESADAIANTVCDGHVCDCYEI